MSYDQALSILRTWGQLGRQLAYSTEPVAVDWGAASRMIASAAPYFKAQVGELINLLHKSDALLKPLADPLWTDFGAHRWLSDDREEAYSDWLEWIVQKLEPAAILDLFAIKKLFPDEPYDDLLALAQARLVTKRDVCVPKAHPNQQGRLDLVIRIDDRAVLVVETKVGDADDCDTAKQIGYADWLQQQPGKKKYPILLATNGDSEKKYDGDFRLLIWSDVCLALRRLAVKLCAKEQVVLAAMMLAFVGAVEQNLLGISVEDVNLSRLRTFDPRILSHLESWIKAEEGER